MRTDERGMMMNATKTHPILAVTLIALALGGAAAWADVRTPTPPSTAGVNPQCPGDIDGDAVADPGQPGYDPCDEPDEPSAANPCNYCLHLAAGQQPGQPAGGGLFAGCR